MALLLTPDGQVHTVDMDDVPALNQQVQAYRILLSYPTFYKQQQVQMFLWQGADQQVKAAAAAPEPGARRLEKPEELQAARQKLAASLGASLLAPLHKYLSGYKQWLISPDGSLSYLPFETLTYQGQPALESADISYIQSLSILELLTQRRHVNSKAERKALLAMGDALYGVGQSEETNEGLQRLGELATHTRGGIAINDNQEKYAWPNLPGTGKEVDEVAALFPPDTRRVYKKKQASEKVLRNLDRSGDLAGYKILLFATHGIFNPKVPELSALVLSQVGNQAPENGYITVSKWMGYNLRSDRNPNSWAAFLLYGI